MFIGPGEVAREDRVKRYAPINFINARVIRFGESEKYMVKKKEEEKKKVGDF